MTSRIPLLSAACAERHKRAAERHAVHSASHLYQAVRPETRRRLRPDDIGARAVLAEISNSSTFMISLRSLCKENYPLWTPLKRKEKPRQARENLSGPFLPAAPSLLIRRSRARNNEDGPRSGVSVPGHALRCGLETSVTSPLRLRWFELRGHPKTYIQSSRPWECGNPEGISKECGKGGKPAYGFPPFPHSVISMACFSPGRCWSYIDQPNAPYSQGTARRDRCR
jgi:hypothetical protein